MKERPILFSAPMIRALLDGRKTQTRRVITTGKRAPWHQMEPVFLAHRWTVAPHPRGGFWAIDVPNASTEVMDRPPGNDTGFQCPYGQPGDRLWVRENGWEPPVAPTIDQIAGGADTWQYVYDADGVSEGDREDFRNWKWKRRPSIHMPRWASRITLEVTGVRVERVQSITPADAVAEGAHEVLLTPDHPLREDAYARGSDFKGQRFAGARDAYAAIWDALNAKRGYPWSANPWVWIIEFKRLTESSEAAA